MPATQLLALFAKPGATWNSVNQGFQALSLRRSEAAEPSRLSQKRLIWRQQSGLEGWIARLGQVCYQAT